MAANYLLKGRKRDYKARKIFFAKNIQVLLVLTVFGPINNQ